MIPQTKMDPRWLLNPQPLKTPNLLILTTPQRKSPHLENSTSRFKFRDSYLAPLRLRAKYQMEALPHQHQYQWSVYKIPQTLNLPNHSLTNIHNPRTQETSPDCGIATRSFTVVGQRRPKLCRDLSPAEWQRPNSAPRKVRVNPKWRGKWLKEDRRHAHQVHHYLCRHQHCC